MGNNRNSFDNGRFRVVDPNDFDNLYGENVFDLKSLNMSVPNEDLCIVVELRTKSKSRTILDTNDKSSSIINTKGGVISFIDGSKNESTGFQNYLTSQYTELGTEVAPLEESIGITSIDIDFNSSYAPMININFVDVRGGAIFQPDGKSRFAVLFSLPYPIFELKVKGFYGKPVTYCLHLIKCQTKFNSQTGNFELAAQFVGYTYAMLSDILLPYLKGVVKTKEGADLLAAKKMANGKPVMNINDFIVQAGNIDGLVGEQLNENSEATNNLSIIKELQQMVNQMKSGVRDVVSTLGVNYQPEQGPTERYPYITIIKNPTDSLTDFKDTKNIYEILPTFNNNYKNMINQFNLKAGENPEIRLNPDIIPIDSVINVEEMFSDADNFKQKIRNNYKYNVDVDEPSIYNTIVNRLKDAATNISRSNRLVKYYDLTDIANQLNEMERVLLTKEEDAARVVAEELRNTLKSKLGVDSTVRSIVTMLTSHVEVFLEMMYNVSKRYKEQNRINELKIFSTQDKSKSIDVKSKDVNANVIYPWPEYFENGVEKYLGSKKGPLKNPLNVPEIEFVEKLYEAISTVSKQEAEITSAGLTSWVATNPLDSVFYTNIKPYDRLDANATPDDIVRLAMLRYMSFVSFSNILIDSDEIIEFAKKEAKLVLEKYENTPLILQALRNYTVDKFTGATGTVNGKQVKLIEPDITRGEYFVYSYINNKITTNGVVSDRYLIPIDKGFNNITFSPTNESFADVKSVKFIVPNTVSNDSVKYIDFIEANKYNSKNVNSPLTASPSTFLFEKMNNDYGPSLVDINDYGFLANNGKFGVQDFNLISYPSTYGVNDAIQYSSLFYESIFRGGNAYPSIGGPRKNATTEFDLNRRQGFKILTDEGDDIDVIYDNYNSLSNTISTFSNITNQSVLAYPFFEFEITKNSFILLNDYTRQLSLFTSRFYNAQTLHGRAFLFLHCFPWRGLYGINDKDKIGFFRQKSITNTFRLRTGFVQTPKLWSAFIGGLLWRYREGKKGPTSDPIKFIIGNEYLLPNFNSNSGIPSYDSYLKHDDTRMSMGFNSSFGSSRYAKIESELLNLPNSVKDAFIQEFELFVDEYKTIKNTFEIIPNKSYDINTYDNLQLVERDIDWKNAWEQINSGTSVNGSLNTIKAALKSASGIPIENSYNIFTYWVNTDNIFKYNFITEFKQNATQDELIKSLFFDYKYVVNNNVDMWVDYSKYTSVVDNRPLTLKTFTKIFADEFISSIKTSVEQKEKTFFDNNENEQVKLEIYRNLKKIYDKWIADVSSEEANSAGTDVIFQCCKSTLDGNPRVDGGRITTDKELAKLRGATKPSLIDSFRFVTRSFEDIGDVFQINPSMLYQILTTSPNNSFYYVIGRILEDNNFDFIALPNFVDYNKPERLKEIFTPYPYYEANDITTGPSFLCVYVGQTSTKLDFGKDSIYPDDTFNFTDVDTIPVDFTQTPKSYEDTGVAFIVRYGQQNQNFFKDIVIDQSEFNETDESLRTVDEIANKYSQANQTYIGQNLYNIHSIRAYKAEIEMMGNAMIQPMMYFQLDNVPMFRGAYLITRVKHNIKPNYMATWFTGVRINKNKTPLIDVPTLYSSMLSGYSLPKSRPASSVTNFTAGKVPPIVQTIIANTGRNGDIARGKIETRNIDLPAGILNSVDSDSQAILAEAVIPLKRMLSDWVAWMKLQKFKGDANGNYAHIISAFRSIQKQEKIKKENPNSSATPGRSNHGWGIAIDFQFLDRNGNVINNYDSKKNPRVIGFDVNNNESIKWLYDNSYKYGWIIPPDLRDNLGTEEFWHWEYHGRSAICILEKNPNIRNYKVDIKGSYFDFVTNPRNPDGTVAVYNTCDYTWVKSLDGTPAEYGGFVKVKFRPSDTIKNIYVPAQEQALPNVSRGSKLLMQAQAQFEGFYKGTKSFDNNNPGNIGTFGNKTRSFNTLTEGVKAQWDEVLGLALSNKSKFYKPTNTLFEYISIYAPVEDNNNPTEYTNAIIGYFDSQNIKITAQTTLIEINNIT